MSEQSVKVGNGKAIHMSWGTDRTACAKNHNDLNRALPTPCDGDVTCKKCLKMLAEEAEQAHAEALIEQAARVDAEAEAVADVQVDDMWTANDGGVAVQVTRVAVSPLPRVSFRRADGNTGALPLEWFLVRYTRVPDKAEAHVEALEMDIEIEELNAKAEAQLAEVSNAHWVVSDAGRWASSGYAHRDGVDLPPSLYCDVETGQEAGVHAGPCYDAAMGVWRAEPAAPSRKQRRAARRAQQAKLRRTAPQARAAAQARRVRRGAARGGAKTLLVAAGVPQDVAQRYASSFSRGVQAPTASLRIRTGAHRSERVNVKRYTWPLFVEALDRFVSSSRRQSFEVMPTFRAARDRVAGRAA